MRRVSRIAARGGRALGLLVLGLLLLVVLVVGLVVAGLHTPTGQRLLTRHLLRVANQHLVGELHVDRIHGSFLHGVELEGVELRDAEGEVALRAPRALVRYRLLALREQRVQIDRVELFDAWARVRYLADGRLNFAALSRPSRDEAPSQLGINIDELVATGAARFEPRPGDAVPPLTGKVRLGGGLRIAGGEVAIAAHTLEVDLEDPAPARLAAQGSMVVRGDTLELGSMHAWVALAGSALPRLVPGAPALRGRYVAEAHASGPLAAIEIALRLRTPSAPIDARGTLAVVDVLRWRGEAHTRGLDLRALLPDAPHARIDAVARGQGDAAGGRVELEELRAAMNGNQARARGHVRFGRSLQAELDATLAAPDLSNLGPYGVPGLHGAAHGVAHVSLADGAIAVRADLTGTQLELGEVTAQQLELHARTRDLTGDVLIVAHGLRHGEINLAMVRAEARGTREAFHLALTAHGGARTSIDLALDGKPRYASRSRRARPVGIDAVVEKLDVERNGERWHMTRPSSVVYDRGLRIGGLLLVSGRQSVSLDGIFEPDSARISATLAGKHLDLRRLAALLGRPPSPYTVPELDLRLEAYLDREAGAFDARLGLGGQPVVSLAVRTPLDPRRVLDSGRWQALPLSLSADLPGFDLAVLAPLLPGVSGRVRGRIEGEGTLGKLAGKGTVAFDALVLGGEPLPRMVVSGGFDGRRVDAALRTEGNAGGSLTLDVHTTLRLDEPLTVSLRAQGFRLEWRARRDDIPLRQLRMQLDGQLDVTGTPREPVFSGGLRVRDGTVAIASDPRVAKDIEVDLTARPGALVVKRAFAKIGSGWASAWGDASFTGVRPTRLDIHADTHKLAVVTNPVAAAVDAKLHLKGQLVGERFMATLQVEDAKAKLPKLGDIQRVQSTGPLADVRYVDARARAAAAQRERLKAGMPVTLAIRAPGPVQLRGPEIMADLRGDVTVELGQRSPTVRGDVSSLGGWIELLGRRYELDGVKASFAGGEDLDPWLDVRLKRRLTEAEIFIEVHGQASKPKLTLRSEPPIWDQSEILAIIVSGDPGEKHMTERSLDKKVAGAISGAVVGAIKDRLAPQLPIDVIKVETGDTGFAGLSSTRIEVGKYLTDAVYVSYVHQFGNLVVGTRRLNANEGELQWRFKRRWVLDLVIGDAPAGRVDLFWSKRY